MNLFSLALLVYPSGPAFAFSHWNFGSLPEAIEEICVPFVETGNEAIRTRLDLVSATHIDSIKLSIPELLAVKKMLAFYVGDKSMVWARFGKDTDRCALLGFERQNSSTLQRGWLNWLQSSESNWEQIQEFSHIEMPWSGGAQRSHATARMQANRGLVYVSLRYCDFRVFGWTLASVVRSETGPPAFHGLWPKSNIYWRDECQG